MSNWAAVLDSVLSPRTLLSNRYYFIHKVRYMTSRHKKILSTYTPDRRNLLRILHDFQNGSDENYISNDDVRIIADFLNLPLSSVYGVITYYSMYSAMPRGKYVVRICDSPVCNLRGADRLISAIKKTLKIDVGETTEDRRFTLELCECLGRCSKAPTLMINSHYHENPKLDELESIFEQYK